MNVQDFEQLLYREARLLDRTEYEAWLELLSDRLHYFAPVRSNVAHEDLDRPRLLAHFDDRKADLVTRVKRIRTGQAHAEEPATRVRRLISNVLLLESTDEDALIASSFLATVSRWDQPARVVSGGREDRWALEDGTWRLRQRRIVFDLTTTANLSFLI